MPRGPSIRTVVRYAGAVVVSAIALTIVGLVEREVGFIPLLLLPAVALVERYAGVGPAVVATVLCTIGPLFMNLPFEHNRIHYITELALFAPVCGSVIYLMESRRKHKREVQEHLLELSTLLDSMPEAVLIFNSLGRVMDANRAAQEMCGCTREDLLGRFYAELAMMLDVQREEQPLPLGQMAVARALRGETVHGEPRSFIKPGDRSQFNAVITASPMRVGENNRIIGALLVVRDVTEITQLQRRIADTERHLAIGQMASGIAHDFNNVLNTITQAVALLEMHPEDTIGAQRTYLDMIDRAARTGAEIIKRVREYIRGGTGEIGPVNVADLLRQAIDLTEPMWRKRKNVKLAVDVPEGAMGRANGPDLQRVFANLIINALQAMPDGGTLTIQCREHEGRVEVSIGDTGVGIAPDKQKKIFLPYYTTKPQGTGLGLSTAQRTLLAQGGNISFNSELGKGTTFHVQLPALTPVQERENVAA